MRRMMTAPSVIHGEDARCLVRGKFCDLSFLTNDFTHSCTACAIKVRLDRRRCSNDPVLEEKMSSANLHAVCSGDDSIEGGAVAASGRRRSVPSNFFLSGSPCFAPGIKSQQKFAASSSCANRIASSTKYLAKTFFARFDLKESSKSSFQKRAGAYAASLARLPLQKSPHRIQSACL